MATATKDNPKALARALKLCRADAEELAKLKCDNATVFAKEKELKARLISYAAARGENYKEIVDGMGAVKVSAPKEKKCTGTAPELVVDTFLALPAGRREALIAASVVKIVEQWSGAFYGSVQFDPF